MEPICISSFLKEKFALLYIWRKFVSLLSFCLTMKECWFSILWINEIERCFWNLFSWGKNNTLVLLLGSNPLLGGKTIRLYYFWVWIPPSVKKNTSVILLGSNPPLQSKKYVCITFGFESPWGQNNTLVLLLGSNPLLGGKTILLYYFWVRIPPITQKQYTCITFGFESPLGEKQFTLY